MAINVKELFVTDLDPNSNVWWSADKIDKINYNFDQFSNGGALGPQGNIGVDGGFGPIGNQGVTGYIGFQGSQGVQGPGVFDEWEYFPERDGLPGYLSPKKNPIGTAQAAPVALRIGFLSSDSGYGESSIQQDTPIQIVKTVNHWTNLRVEDNNSFNGYNFGFDLTSNISNTDFKISPDITGSEFRIIYTAENIVLKTGNAIDSIKNSITITDSNINIDTGGDLGVPFILNDSTGKTTRSKDAFIFDVDAIEGRILVSTSTSGNVEWKDVKDVFGTFPMGSIISIRPEEFNANNFWLNESINVTTNLPLKNIYGRGKIGTDFEGWYLCNGERWETVEGFNQFLTPNLNNFNYSIDGNNWVQQAMYWAEGDPILIGGYDIQVAAIPDENGVYDVKYINRFSGNDASSGNNTISMQIVNTNDAYLCVRSRMIHIIYLKNPNLKWTNTGYDYTKIVTNSITLTRPAISSILTYDLQIENNYSWNGSDDIDWNTFTVPSTEYKLFDLGTTMFAKSGWYRNIDGYPIYWNSHSGSFTKRGVTYVSPTIKNVFLMKYSELVDELNGATQSLIGVHYLDYEVPFSTARSLRCAVNDPDSNPPYVDGDLAPAGWYRDIENGTGVRRFWNGSSFEGTSFSEDYVTRVESELAQSNPGYSAASVSSPENSVCDLPFFNHLTYVSGESALTVPSGTTLTEHIKNYDSALYVTSGWEEPSYSGNSPIYTPALVNIKDQVSPGSTLKYNKVFMIPYYYDGDNSDWGLLSVNGSSATGKITIIDSCTVDI
jgi:hypothetical protein